MRTLQQRAIEYDRTDPLKSYRKLFVVPKDTIYLNSHSLGLPTKKGILELKHVTEEWGKLGVKGWLHAKKPWFTLPEQLSEEIAFIFGAKKNEIILQASNTVNLYAILFTFFKPKGKRKKILIEGDAFPTDRYAIQAVLKHKGCDAKTDLIEVKQENMRLDEESILQMIDESVAIVILPSVQYLSGQYLDIRRITEFAHKKGTLVCFVCAHSAGLIQHTFHADGVDFATFCGYKYLCAGPGSVGGMFIHEKHHGVSSELPGWWGSKKERQFNMLHSFLPENGPRGFQMATSHILSLAPVVGIIEVLKECGMKALNSKRSSQMKFLMEGVRDLNAADSDLKIITPNSAYGGHIAIMHPQAAAIVKELVSERIVVDYREPNLIRIAPHPLYTKYSELAQFLKEIKKVLHSRSYLKHENKRCIVA